MAGVVGAGVLGEVGASAQERPSRHIIAASASGRWRRTGDLRYRMGNLQGVGHQILSTEGPNI